MNSSKSPTTLLGPVSQKGLRSSQD